jgi:hypothetical protein
VSTATLPLPQTAKMRELFDTKPPVLVEVRFPGMGTSPDWYFCREEDELETILSRLSPGVEVHLHSVWDVTDPTGGITVRR